MSSKGERDLQVCLFNIEKILFFSSYFEMKYENDVAYKRFFVERKKDLFQKAKHILVLLHSYSSMKNVEKQWQFTNWENEVDYLKLQKSILEQKWVQEVYEMRKGMDEEVVQNIMESQVIYANCFEICCCVSVRYHAFCENGS